MDKQESWELVAEKYRKNLIAAERRAEQLLEDAHRLEDRCVAAEEERNAAEARADAIERRGMRRQRRHRKWALKKARHWMHLFDVAGDRTMVAERRAEALEAENERLREVLIQALARIREAIMDEVTDNNHTVDLRNVVKQGEAALTPQPEAKEESRG